MYVRNISLPDSNYIYLTAIFHGYIAKTISTKSPATGTVL